MRKLLAGLALSALLLLTPASAGPPMCDPDAGCGGGGGGCTTIQFTPAQTTEDLRYEVQFVNSTCNQITLDLSLTAWVPWVGQFGIEFVESYLYFGDNLTLGGYSVQEFGYGACDLSVSAITDPGYLGPGHRAFVVVSRGLVCPLDIASETDVIRLQFFNAGAGVSDIEFLPTIPLWPNPQLRNGRQDEFGIPGVGGTVTTH